MAETLAVRISDTAQAEVFRNNNGDFSNAVGNPWTPANAESGAATAQWKHNVGCQFGDSLYVWVGTEIRKYNSGTSDWDVVRDVTLDGMGTTAALASRHSGLFVGIAANGAPILYGLFYDNGGSVLAALSSSDGSTWAKSTSSIAGTGFSPGGFKGGYSYRNTLYVGYAQDTPIVSFNPGTGSFASFSPAAFGLADTPAFDMTVVNNRLFLLYGTAGANTYPNLYEFQAGVFSQVVAGSASFAALQYDASQNPGGFAPMLLFRDDTADELIAMGYTDRGGGDRGMRAWRIPWAHWFLPRSPLPWCLSRSATPTGPRFRVRRKSS